MGKAQSSDIDRFLGSRIRKLRLMACVSQQQVAKQLGVSPQQMHKFEKGTGR
jgi:transcriptional regulator with XRE-family HTH domain